MGCVQAAPLAPPCPGGSGRRWRSGGAGGGRGPRATGVLLCGHAPTLSSSPALCLQHLLRIASPQSDGEAAGVCGGGCSLGAPRSRPLLPGSLAPPPTPPSLPASLCPMHTMLLCSRVQEHGALAARVPFPRHACGDDGGWLCAAPAAGQLTAAQDRGGSQTRSHALSPAGSADIQCNIPLAVPHAPCLPHPATTHCGCALGPARGRPQGRRRC